MNPNCGNGHCTSATGEVRLLPTGKHGSHNTLCRQCYEHEMSWRRKENVRLGQEFQWNFPAWESLEVWGRMGKRNPDGNTIVFSVESADRSVGIMSEGFSAYQVDAAHWCNLDDIQAGKFTWYDNETGNKTKPPNDHEWKGAKTKDDQ